MARGADIGAQLVLGGAQAARDVAQAVRGSSLSKAATELVGGGTEEAAGEVLQSTVPTAIKALRQKVQANTFDRAARFARKFGLELKPGSDPANKLNQALLEADAKWGATMNPAERQTVDQITRRLNNASAPPLTYDELDQYMIRLNQIRRTAGSSSVRAAVDQALDDVVAGTPAANFRAAGKAAWEETVRDANKVARLVRTADTPVSAFSRTIGRLTDPGRAKIVRDALGADSNEWRQVTQGFFEKLFRNADSPAAVAAKWNALAPGVREVFDQTGEVAARMKDLGRLPGASTVARIGAIFPGYRALRKASEGDWRGAATDALTAAAIVGAPSGAVRTGLVGTTAAIPAAARTAAAVSGPIFKREMEEVNRPSPLEESSSAPAAPPAPARPEPSAPEPKPQEAGGGAPSAEQPARSSSSSGLPIYPNAAGFVFHHSGGSSLAELRDTLGRRGLGSQYLMDRDGTIYPYGGEGSPHIQPNDAWGGDAPGLSNKNAIGMELVAKDDSDVTPEQIASARRFIAENYPNIPVYGHGEVNPGHKQATEGATVARAVREDRVAQNDRYVGAVSNVVGIPANLMRSVIRNESGGDPTLLSRETVHGVHAHGVMQIMPSTFEGYRKQVEAITGREANIDDPLDNLVAGALHLKDDLAASGGDIASAARRYTGGPDPRRWGPKTHWYGNKVANDYAMMERG